MNQVRSLNWIFKGPKSNDMYRKITMIQELLDDRNIADAKRELEYLRQELQFKNRR